MAVSKKANFGVVETDDPWLPWIRDVGVQIRRVREFVGLSQEALANLAGVSQGAVSRLENGRGLATPLVGVVKIHVALTQRLRAIETGVLNDGIRRAVEAEHLISPPVAGLGYEALPVTTDPLLEEIVRGYRGLSPDRRQHLVTVFRALVAAFDGDGGRRTP